MFNDWSHDLIRIQTASRSLYEALSKQDYETAVEQATAIAALARVIALTARMELDSKKESM